MRWGRPKHWALVTCFLLAGLALLLSRSDPLPEDAPPGKPVDVSRGGRAPSLPAPSLPDVESGSDPIPSDAVSDSGERLAADRSNAATQEEIEELERTVEELARLSRPTLPDAKVVEDPVTRGPLPTAPGRARKLGLTDLVFEGFPVVTGTRELTGDRKPKLEEGIPVSLTGRVVEEGTGRPVEGASVILRSTFYLRRFFYDHHLLEVARAETGPDGEFLIERLNVEPVHFGKGGLVFVSVMSPDHAPLLAVPLEGVTPGFKNRLPDLEVSRERYTITGRVIDYWERKPVVGGRVVATGEILPIRYPKDQREALFLSAPETVTDKKGRFVLSNVGGGRQTLSVHGGNDCAGYLEVLVPVNGEVTISTRQIRGRIEGKVLDERGEPIAVVKVDGGDNTTHTFADGSFVLENFRGDEVNLVFTHPDFKTKVVPGVVNGSNEVLVRLTHLWPEVTFRVRDHATEKPVKKVSIVLQFEEGRESPLPASPYSISKKGLHRIRVPEGVTAAMLVAEGYEEQVVLLMGAREGDVIDVLLQRGRRN